MTIWCSSSESLGDAKSGWFATGRSADACVVTNGGCASRVKDAVGGLEVLSLEGTVPNTTMPLPNIWLVSMLAYIYKGRKRHTVEIQRHHRAGTPCTVRRIERPGAIQRPKPIVENASVVVRNAKLAKEITARGRVEVVVILRALATATTTIIIVLIIVLSMISIAVVTSRHPIFSRAPNSQPI